jgi:glycosyltransferase involved in cell wall biosynthesis
MNSRDSELPTGRRPYRSVSVLWATNLPAPYRLPLWEALGRHVDLEVGLLAEADGSRQWRPPDTATSYRLCILKWWTIPLHISRLARSPGESIVVLGGWERFTYVVALVFASAARIPVVGFYESTLKSHQYHRGPPAMVRRMFFRRLESVVTVGPASYDALRAMNVPSDRISTGFNPVDVEHFHRSTISARIGASARAGHHYIYVGQLIARKNVGSALKAWADIRKHEDSFTIVGTGKLENELYTLAARLGVTDVVRFLGRRAEGDVIAEYAKAQTLVLPSTEEVWGLVVNEALAAGLHVVISRDLGVTRSVEHMRGVFVSEPDAQSLAQALAASRAAWSGPIPNPEILKYTPERFAICALRAIEQARRRSAAKRLGAAEWESTD